MYTDSGWRFHKLRFPQRVGGKKMENNYDCVVLQTPWGVNDCTKWFPVVTKWLIYV